MKLCLCVPITWATGYLEISCVSRSNLLMMLSYIYLGTLAFSYSSDSTFIQLLLLVSPISFETHFLYRQMTHNMLINMFIDAGRWILFPSDRSTLDIDIYKRPHCSCCLTVLKLEVMSKCWSWKRKLFCLFGGFFALFTLVLLYPANDWLMSDFREHIQEEFMGSKVKVDEVSCSVDVLNMLLVGRGWVKRLFLWFRL